MHYYNPALFTQQIFVGHSLCASIIPGLGDEKSEEKLQKVSALLKIFFFSF